MSVLFQTYTMTGNMPIQSNYISQFGFPWTAASKTNQQRSSIIPGKETYCLRYISNICIISGKFRHKVQSIIDFDTSSSPLASLDGFLRSHGAGLYVMQLVVAATNQNELYKKHMLCRKNVSKIKM